MEYCGAWTCFPSRHQIDGNCTALKALRPHSPHTSLDLVDDHNEATALSQTWGAQQRSSDCVGVRERGAMISLSRHNPARTPPCMENATKGGCNDGTELADRSGRCNRDLCGLRRHGRRPGTRRGSLGTRALGAPPLPSKASLRACPAGGL